MVPWMETENAKIQKWKMWTNEKWHHVNLQKLIILEGFRQNGHHHWIQHIFLRIVAPIKIDFRHFFENDIFWHENNLKLYYIDALKAWDYAQTIFRSEKLQIAYPKAENGTTKYRKSFE